jgi:hypothetical protein
MGKINRRWLLTSGVVLIAAAIWFAVREYRCTVRGSIFAQQVETIKQDAAKELRIGTDKTGVAKFFTSHGMSFSTWGPEAYGGLHTLGCAPPIACGTDIAFITVRVKLDANGAVAEAPNVTGMYKDCV